MKSIFTLAYVFLFIYHANSQSTSDCGSKGCFLSPTGCTDTSCAFIFKYTNNGDYTNFELYAKVGSSAASKWLAIGFSKDDHMGDDCVVVCKQNMVQHNYNDGYNTRVLFSDPSVGITNQVVKTMNDWLACNFTRQKKNDSVPNYFDLNTSYFILAAEGNLDSSGGISKHDSKVHSDSLVSFTSTQTVGGKEEYHKYKTHGCLMVIAWIFFASTGILLPRYYKFLFPKLKLCKVDFWFVLHRPLMLMVPVLSITAFLVILAQLNWQWVETDEPVEFTHSIFGIVAIGISVIQPFIGFIRCDKDHKYRFIFNYVHRVLGISALIFSIVAMFLGSILDDMGLGDNGWGILAGWTVWVVCLPVALEILELKYESPTRSHQYEVTTGNKSSIGFYHNIKKMLFFFHLIVALGFTVALVVLIGIAEPEEEH